MFKDIPFSFKNPNENYLIINKLQEFCKENQMSTTGNKIELINSIIEFGKQNDKNSIKVLEWLDSTLKEGIKKIIIFKVEKLNDLKNKSSEEWISYIKNNFNINDSKYVINANHFENISLCGYKVDLKDGKVNVVSLNYSILLKEQKNKDLEPKKIIYPIFIDLYVQYGYIIGRSKSKTSLFKIIENDDSKDLIPKLETINCDKLIIEAINFSLDKFNLSKEKASVSNHKFKKQVHNIIDECTKTPDEILNKLTQEEASIKTFVEEFFNRNNIEILTGENFNHAVEDLKILMEKYISINYNDKSIFTNNRYAYPIQIGATDEDFSSIEETSMGKPLQCTPIFFDNKKVIQKQKKCDNVALKFKRIPKMYFPNEIFQVELIAKKGMISMDLRQYVLEEDIKNVLSRIIRTN